MQNDKNNQIRFVGGLKKRTANPRWRTVAILKNRQIFISQQRLCLSARNLALWRIMTLRNLLAVKISNSKKSKMADSRHIEKPLKLLFQQQFSQSAWNWAFLTSSPIADVFKRSTFCQCQLWMNNHYCHKRRNSCAKSWSGFTVVWIMASASRVLRAMLHCG